MAGINNKYFKIGMIIFICLILFFILKYKYNIYDNFSEKKYINYAFSSQRSNIRIDCQIDSDCQIVKRNFACYSYESIHKSNSDKDWAKYDKKSQFNLRFVDLIMDCPREYYKSELLPICNQNNICDYEIIERDKRCLDLGGVSGDCDVLFEGYVFDGSECLYNTIKGCNSSISFFNTIEECEEVCK